MRECKIDLLVRMFGALHDVSRDLNAADVLGQPYFDFKKMKPVNLARILDGLVMVCEEFDVDPALIEQIKTFESELRTNSLDLRDAVLRVRVEAIIAGVRNNLDSRKFMYMPPDEASSWQNPAYFGGKFLRFFPKAAKLEGREAGNCFAASRWTACVFHCMRLAEYGLRQLARNLRVGLTDKGKNCPVEYGTWDKVITEIRNKILESRQLPAGPKKEQSLQFHSSAADACEYMKNIWRNEVAHTRRLYSKQEARTVIERVRDFTQLVARHGVEKTRGRGSRQVSQKSSAVTPIRPYVVNTNPANEKSSAQTKGNSGAAG